MQSSSSGEKNHGNIIEMASDIKSEVMQVGSPGEAGSQMVESSTDQNKEYDKHLDITCKLLLARNIVTACRKEKNLSKRDAIQKVNYYTGISVKTLKKMKTEVKVPRTFLLWDLHDNSLHTFSQRHYDIREILVKYYITKRIVPSKSVLIKELKEKGYNKEDILDLLLDIAGFMWQDLPRINKSIIMEKPEQAFKRYLYLQKIKKYRDKNTDFIYVENSCVPYSMPHASNKQNTHSSIFIAASPITGVINMSFYTKDMFFKNWITNVLVHVLPSSSVLVINDKDFKDDDTFLPTPCSKKCEMIEWLKIHNIPHDPNAHRAELFKILQMYKVHLKKNAVVKHLFDYGHEVIRRPDNVTPYNFFSTLWTMLFECTETEIKKKTTRFQLLDMIKKCRPEDWIACERKISEIESKMYAEDMEMEEIMDSLMAMAKNGDTSAFQELGPENWVKETPPLSDIILD